MNHFKAEQEVGGMSTGHNVGHEVMESYIAAKYHPNIGVSNLQGSRENQVYMFAHTTAISLDRTYNHSVNYGGYEQNGMRTYYVEKPLTINGVAIPAQFNRKILYSRPIR